MCIKVSKKLAITTWNVNGLYKRISGDRICKLDDKIIDHVIKKIIVFVIKGYFKSFYYYLYLYDIYGYYYLI
jgi:hypothetical protein